ncbi:hypothetical protein CMUS01_08094 [Colletotrichum musicola]|uniref:Clr5 domain-containing protein n=1 Tax=Colletotrichum musicola TaxID=2175873 RepID=A0A8H6NEI1_9PEZI|nr:hypothetical protein CMUS01_08094 [Colletotrichum musicola]
MPPPPTTEEWERHRSLISEMYARRPLKTVRAHMKEAYGFHATDRMFKGRFKQWGVEKNRRLKHRDSNPDELTSPTSPPLGQQFVPDHHQHINLPPPPPRKNPYTPTRSFTPPDEPAINDEPMSDAPSATASPEPAHEQPEPSSFTHPEPLTPATTFGELTPPVRHDDDNLSADQTRGEIVRLASEILERWREIKPGDDHVEIYRTLSTKLRYEGQLRSSLVNRQLAEGECKTVAGKIVDDMLQYFHHTVPIGVLSTMNQLTSRSTTQELVDCLVDSSKKTATAAETEDVVELFGQLARRLHHLLEITDADESQAGLEDICRRLEDRVEETLGAKSTVGLYLALLLNAKKAKCDQRTDKKLRDKALAMARHVQLHYADEPRLVLDFDRFVVSYLSIVAPAEKEVLDMANSFYERAVRYHDVHVDAAGQAERDGGTSQHARVVYGHSCALLADCLYARDEGKDRESARGLLFQSIYCYANAPWATMANAERQMTKFRSWCEEAGDEERLGLLGSISSLIETNETRKRGEPLMARMAT